jgi:hypothetical protein
VLRLLAAVLACASFVFAVDPEDHISKSTPVTSATRLVLTADTGTLRIEPGNGKSVDVEVYFHGTPPSRAEFQRMLRDFALDIDQQGLDIRMSGAFRGGWEPLFDLAPFFSGHPICRNWQCLEYSTWLREVEYRVRVPQKFNADVETSGGPIYLSSLDGQVNARSSGGGITLTSCKGNAIVHTSGGPIRIRDVAGDVDASTSGGPISIERNSGRVKAHTSGGGIEIRDAMGAINASTSGGGVTASLLGQPKEECRLYTSGGSIDVRLSKDIRMDLDASTSGGRVWTDFAVPISDDRHYSQLRAPLNGGGPRLYLHTSGGGITVRHAD